MGSDSAAFDLVVNEVVNNEGAIDKVNAELGQTEQKTKETAKANDEASLSLSDLNQGLELVNKTLDEAQRLYDETIGVSQQYAETIRDLKAVSGESAEDTSRFVQVLDDYQISAEDAMTATRALTKNGLAPNINTLAELSDKYLQITDIQERNEFVIKNLGKSGLEWNNVLSQGSKALRENAAAVSPNLIMTEAMIQRAERLRLEEDKLDDALKGLKITIGEMLTPAVLNGATALASWTDQFATNVGNIQHYNEVLDRANEIMKQNGEFVSIADDTVHRFGMGLDATTLSAMRQAEAERNASDATGDHARAMEEAARQADALEKAQEAANSTYLSQLGNVSAAEETFAQKRSALSAERMTLEEKLANTPAWDKKHAEEYNQQIDQVKAKESDLFAQRQQDNAKLVQQLLEQKLAQDGLTDAELKFLVQQGENSGVYAKGSSKALDEAMAAAQKLADQQKTSQDQAAQDEQKLLDMRKSSYSTYSQSITEKVNTNISDVQRYIDQLSQIPSSVNTDLTTTTQIQ